MGIINKNNKDIVRPLRTLELAVQQEELLRRHHQRDRKPLLQGRPGTAHSEERPNSQEGRLEQDATRRALSNGDDTL